MAFDGTVPRSSFGFRVGALGEKGLATSSPWRQVFGFLHYSNVGALLSRIGCWGILHVSRTL